MWQGEVVQDRGDVVVGQVSEGLVGVAGFVVAQGDVGVEGGAVEQVVGGAVVADEGFQAGLYAGVGVFAAVGEGGAVVPPVPPEPRRPPRRPDRAKATLGRLIAAISFDDGRPRWDLASPYLIRHLIEHAVAADEADVLLADPEFLVHADPATLEPLTHKAATPAAAELVAAYRASLARHRIAPAEVRRRLLAADAAVHGARDVVEALATGPGWAPRWAAVHAAEVVGVESTTSLVVTGDGDGGLHAWSPSNGDIAARSGITGPVRAMSVSGVRVLVGGDRGTLATWTPGENGSEELANRHFGRVLAVGWAGAGTIVSAAGEGGLVVRALAVSHGEPVLRLPNRVRVVACATVGERPLAVCGGNDGRVVVVDLLDRVPIAAVRLHDAPVCAITCAVLNNRPVVVTASEDGVLHRSWLPNLEQVGTPVHSGTGRFGALVVATFGDRPAVVGGGDDATLRTHDLATGELVDSTAVPHPVAALAYRSPERMLLVASGRAVLAMTEGRS